jgi:hypothetical protein
MSLFDLRRRLDHLAGATATPETGIPPALLAGLKRHWKSQWPQQTETDWPRHLRVIDKVLHMNSEQRAAMLAELDDKLNSHKGAQ